MCRSWMASSELHLVSSPESTHCNTIHHPVKVWVSTGTCTSPSSEGSEEVNQGNTSSHSTRSNQSNHKPHLLHSLNILKSLLTFTCHEHDLPYFHPKLWTGNFPWCCCSPEPLSCTPDKLLPCHTRATVPVSGCQHLENLTSRRINLGSFLPSCKEFLTRPNKAHYIDEVLRDMV